MHEAEANDDAVVERILAVRASHVETREVKWLWLYRVPLGKITVLDGHPGQAKSTIALDVSARITAGRAMPDGSPGIEGDVVVLSYEDDAADTIVPRFLAAGGNPERLHLGDTVITAGGVESLEIPDHVALLEALVAETRAVLLVVDPLTAGLSAEVKTGVDHHVRKALVPLKGLAERTGAAVICIRHLNKDQKQTNPLLRGGGSIGIIGAARAGLIVGQDPEDPERHVLAISKSNLAPSGQPSLAYRVVTDEMHGVGAIEWLGTTTRSASELLATPDAGGRSTKIEQAMGHIRELLSTGPREAGEVKRFLAGNGISERTMWRARERLPQVRTYPKMRTNGSGADVWLWEWAETPDRAAAEEF